MVCEVLCTVAMSKSALSQQLFAISQAGLSRKHAWLAYRAAMHVGGAECGSSSSASELLFEVDAEVDARLRYVRPHLAALVDGVPPSGAARRRRNAALHWSPDSSRLGGAGHGGGGKHFNMAADDVRDELATLTEAFSMLATRVASLENVHAADDHHVDAHVPTHIEEIVIVPDVLQELRHLHIHAGLDHDDVDSVSFASKAVVDVETDVNDAAESHALEPDVAAVAAVDKATVRELSAVFERALLTYKNVQRSVVDAPADHRHHIGDPEPAFDDIAVSASDVAGTDAFVAELDQHDVDSVSFAPKAMVDDDAPSLFEKRPFFERPLVEMRCPPPRR